MLSRKMCQSFLFYSNFIYKNNSSRYYSGLSPTASKIYTRLSSVIAASAAVVGLTVYVKNKRDPLCENIEENKKINVPVEIKAPVEHDYEEAIRKSRDLLQRVKDEVGAPGIVVGVSVNGKDVWAEGLGYADVENRVPCSSDTVMRIASISKSITMAAVAKLWEEGKLDLDKPIQEYVPYFPTKQFNKKPVTITCRQLVSHLGGIRHYYKPAKQSLAKKTEGTDKQSKENGDEFDALEYHIKDHYNDVKSALDLFKDDPLVSDPGSKFYYSTHGWTLISAIVEAASKEQFPIHMKKLFKTFGMSNTYLDVNDSLIYYRSRNYIKNKNGHLTNAPYVDNSYKWAGGGFLSTVGDLLKFGNTMLYSRQCNPVLFSINTKNKQNIKGDNSDILFNVSEKDNNSSCPGYLGSKTVEAMWTPVIDHTLGKYAMGWSVIPDVKECLFCKSKTFVFHTGGAVGASSILLILPQSDVEINDLNHNVPPKGIVVAILTNMQSVSLQNTALKIAQIFDKVF